MLEFYAVPTARVVFTVKTSFDIFLVLAENKLGVFQSRVIESMR